MEPEALAFEEEPASVQKPLLFGPRSEAFIYRELLVD